MVKIIIILLMLFISTDQLLATEQSLFLLNNIISYGEWPANTTDLPQYYLKVKRQQKLYQNNIEFSHHDFQDRSQWQTKSAYPYYPANLPPYFLMDDSNSLATSYIIHQLESNEINFLNFSFEYKLSNYNSGAFNRPVISLDLCGQKNYFVLSYQDFTLGNINDNLNHWKTVVLPNPRTCEHNRELKFSMWLRHPGEKQTIFKMRHPSFRRVKLREDDDIKVISSQSQELALIEDITVKDQGEEILSSWSDWQATDWQIGTIINDEVIASEPLPKFSDQEINLNLTEFKITQVQLESDDSLSVKFSYQVQSNLKSLVLGISDNLDNLYGAWDDVIQLENDYLPSERGINYTSHYDHFQIAHYPFSDKFDHVQLTHFYLTARAKDHEERWSQMSPIWACHNLECHEINSDNPKEIVISRIFWSPSNHEASITLSNQAKNSINLDDWLLSEGLEEGLKLSGELVPQEEKVIKFSNLSRSGGNLKLFNHLGELHDQYFYQAISAPWSWQKNLITNNWKAIYVRN